MNANEPARLNAPALFVHLQRASGIAAALLDAALPLWQEPPPGSVEVDEIARREAGNDPARAGLLLAILVAIDFRRHGELLRALLDYLIPQEDRLPPFDQGRLWHIAGFAAWRLDNDRLVAITALERSLQRLEPLDTAAARAYLGRTWTSLAQLMHHQGRFHEARFGFETALAYRQRHGTPIDRAFTLGNLARVCMDEGDYAAAIDYFQQDLVISRSIVGTPPHVEVQLLSEVAAAQLLLGQLDDARASYQESLILAGQHSNAIGLAFGHIGLGRVALAQQPPDLAAARTQLHATRDLLGQDMPPGLKAELTALVDELHGDLHAASGDHQQAIRDWQAARQHFEAATTSVPREIGQLLFKLAQAHLELGEEMEGALILRSALSRIDATSLDELRRDIEGLFRQRFPQLWMLHAAGRFIGQRQIDRFLDQAGRRGFLGNRQEMAVLFSDIRGFTSLSEGLAPEELISLLNDFLSRMTRSIEQFGGQVDKFIGDAVMALFADEEPSLACANAARAALMMQAELEYFNRELASQGQHLSIGVGLHFGALVSGLIGSPQKRSFTVIGDVVNTASRLEGMTKQLGAGILLSADLASHLDDGHFLLRPLGRFSPKGRNQAIAVFDLMGLDGKGRQTKDWRDEIGQCQAALEELEGGQIDNAIEAFHTLASTYDGHAAGYRQLVDLISAQRDQDHLPALVLKQK